MNVSGYIGHGWETFKRNPAPYVVAALAVMIGGALLGVAGSVLPFMLGTIVGWGVSGIACGALAVLGLRGSRGQSVELADLGAVFSRPVDYIVVGLAMTVGVVLCFVGVWITQALFSFALFYVYQGDGFQDALSRSIALVKPRFTDVLFLVIAVALLNFIGILTCGIGLLVSVPVGFIALAKAFDQLTLEAGQAPIVTPAPYPQQLP